MTVSTLLAVLLHLPFTPAMPLLRTMQRLAVLREPPREDDVPEKIELPIELVEPPAPAPTEDRDAFSLPPPAPPAPAPTAAARPPARPGRPTTPPKPPARPPRKGPQGQEPEPQDPGNFPVGGDAPDEQHLLADPTPGPGKDQAPARGGAVGLKGNIAREIKGKPAVSLALWLSSLQAHPVAPAVGALLACNHEWKPFLPPGSDPLQEIEGFLMVGPQITSAARATVAVQHRATPERIQGLFDSLLRRSGPRGKWLQDGVARVIVQRTERVLFTHPTSMLFLSPPEAWKQIHGQPDPISLPEARGRVMNLTLQQPARPLRRLGIELPAGFTELRADGYANQDGGADLQLDLVTRDEATAAALAPELNRTFRLFLSDALQLSEAVLRLAPDAPALDPEALRLAAPTFSPVGPRLTATLRLAPHQVTTLLRVLNELTCRAAPPRRKP